MAKPKPKPKPKKSDTIIKEDLEEPTDTIIKDEDLTFDIFTYKGRTLYKDKFGVIWNSNAELLGTVIKVTKDNKEVDHYEMFDRKIDTTKDIYKFLK